MATFDPRSKNRMYLTRETEGQFGFTCGNNTDTFAHHCTNFSYNTTHEGRVDEGNVMGRANTCWRNFYRDEDGVRRFDEPDDYYRDSRNPL